MFHGFMEVRTVLGEEFLVSRGFLDEWSEGASEKCFTVREVVSGDQSLRGKRVCIPLTSILYAIKPGR